MKSFTPSIRIILLLAWPFVAVTGGLAQDDASPFDRWDADGDGRLTIMEMFHREGSDAPAVPLLERHLRIVEGADADSDGALSREEYDVARDAVAATVEADRWLWTNAWPKFAELDGDGNRVVSRDEFLGGVTDDRRAQREREFVVVDFDDSGGLSFAEYVCLPGIAPAKLRGLVPDPVAEVLEEKLTALESLLHDTDANEDGVSAESEWPRDRISQMPDLASSGSFAVWDRNSDGQIDPAELRFRLEVLYGIRHETGPRLRTETGLVLFLRGIEDRDDNRDLVLTLEELMKFDRNNPDRYQQAIEELDDDGDGRLSLAELAESDSLHCTDTLSRFRQFDSDLNGSVSPEELSTHVESWNRSFVDQSFPEFDLDGDGLLSFREFRGSPQANLYRDWRPEDEDGDGWISPEEYRGDGGPTCFGLSSLFFSRLDRDGDGKLGLREVDFDIDPTRVPVERLFSVLDRNKDGRLTLFELAGRDESDEKPAVLLERHRRSFEEADLDNDGHINETEFRSDQTLASVAIDEKWLSESARPKFGQWDENGDGEVTLAELVSVTPDERRLKSERDFRIVDFDTSGGLSFNEFLCLPAIAPARRRGAVPDPTVALMEEQLTQLTGILEEADRDSDGRWSRETWPERSLATEDALRPWAAFDFWDGNDDGRVTPQELRFRLEVLYGIRHQTGVRLRRETGVILDWRAFQDRDKDRDLRLTVEEVTAIEPGRGTESFKEDLAELDIDRDGRMSLDELGHGSRKYWRDTLGDFRQLDDDLNGLVDPQELMENVRSWERNAAEQVFPVFDENGDGELSFREYRACPLGNPYRNWGPQDEDADGRISRTEYHGGSNPLHAVLSGVFFARLDQDNDGSLAFDEVAFRVDLKTAPLPLVFQVHDANGDGLLSLDEVTGDAPTSDLNSQSRLDYERKLMRIEDGLRMADDDRDGLLTLAEFTSNEEAAAAMFPGRARSGRQFSPAASVAAPVEAAGEEWNVRLIGLVALNIVVLAGLCWFLFKPSTSR